MRSALLVLVCVSASVGACHRPADGHPPGGHGHSTSDSTPSGSDTTPPGSTGVTGDTGPEGVVYDCAEVPDHVGSVRTIDGAKAYHDVAFTPDGFAIGASLFDDLLKVDYDGNVSVFVPSAGGVEQMTWLPDGDLAIASATYGIVRVTAGGATSVINPNIRPYGLITGPDGLLYAADQNQVHRVDPDTGDSEVVVPSGALDRGTPRVIAFSLDDTRLFVGTYSGTQGRIYAIDLDANYDPVATPVVYASGVGNGQYHDAIGVDICGYLYVPDYSTAAVYRVSPSGDQVQKLLDEGFIQHNYGHGLEWGNGVGGWLEQALYLAQPYHNNNVAEVWIGVPSRFWTGGTAINVP